MSVSKIVSVEDAFIPLVAEASAWGIYDTELKQFVKCKGSNKSAWAEKRHAACAFANAVYEICGWRRDLKEGQTRYIKDNPRYKIIQYGSLKI